MSKTNTTIVKDAIGTPKECLWQFTPDEMPDDVNVPFALEMWRAEDGSLHLFQMFVKHDRYGETEEPWYSNIEHTHHFVTAKGN